MAVVYVSAQGALSNTVSSGLTTFTITLGGAISPGSTICIGAAGAPSIGSLVHWTLTDNASGNTYQRVTDVYDSVGGFEAAMFLGVNIQNGPTTLTLHSTTGTFGFVAILADVFTGVSIVSPLDGDNGQVQGPPGPGTGTNAISSGSFSPATSGDLIWGYSVNEGSFGGDAVGTGFTQGRTDSSSYLSEYNLSGASGSQAATFTNATHGGDATGVWLSFGMALKAAVPTTLSPPQKQWVWVGNAPSLTSNVNLQTVQKQWQWVANAPAISIGLILLPPQKAWAWFAHAPVLNTVVQTVQKAWAWVPHAPTISHALQTVKKSWVWLAQAPTLIPSTIINPPRALWAWVGRAPILSGGNIPGHIKHGFNVMRGVMWGVLSGIDRGEMR